MLTFVTRRVLALVPLLLVVSIITFALVYLVPGDPALRLAGEAATAADVARIRAELGLDAPPVLQYLSWLGDAVRLDFGSSIFTGEPVSSELGRRFPVTASLVLVAVVFALLTGIPLGILAALRRGRATDRAVSGLVSFGLAMPSYWLAMVLIVTFGLTLRWFPVRGYTPFAESPGEWLQRLVLPGIAVGLVMAATLARQLRGALVDVLDQDYVRTARATGLGPMRVVGKHALKNAAMPAITVLGLQVGYLFGGTVIVEQIFAVPGVGSYLVNGIIGQDLPVIQGCVAVLAVLVLGTNLLVDIAYGLVNPRVRGGVTLLDDPVAPVAPDDDPRTEHFLRRLVRRPAALAALIFLVLLAAAAVLAPVIAPYDPNQQDLDNLYAGPSAAHWLGQDDLGRDILSRVLHGAVVSLASSVVAVGLALLVAVPLGLVSGFLGGVVDAVLMRIVDGVQSIPPLVTAIAVAGLLGPSLRNIVIALAVIFTPTFVRLVRGQTLAVREEVFVEASRSVGGSAWWILRRRVLHNIASPLIVQVAITLGFRLLAEAGLSFLGLGIQPPDPSWGGMLAGAYADILTQGWAVFPAGLAIVLTVWAFNLLGDGLRDLLGTGR